MTGRFKTLLSSFVARTPLNRFPVRVKGGLARGARWTLLPHSSYWRGYETDVDAAILKFGPFEGACCWDLGAHFGIYTVGLGRAVGPAGQVASFEPDPFSHARCARHIRMNRLEWVKLFNAAAGEVAATQKLIVKDGLGSPGNHFRYEDEPENPGERIVPVKTLVLDDLVDAGVIRPPVFAKVDVEGHGAKALGGARRTLAKHRPNLIMSFHSHFESGDTRALLEPLGYRCTDLGGGELPWPGIVFRTVRLVAHP